MRKISSYERQLLKSNLKLLGYMNKLLDTIEQCYHLIPHGEKCPYKHVGTKHWKPCKCKVSKVIKLLRKFGRNV